jgi:uncharacterized protein YajQ (UPF0234 family)
MPTFDVVSKIEQHELENALVQAKKEVETRYDFKGTNSEIERTAEGIVLRSTNEQRVAALLDVVTEKVIRRKLSPKILDPQPAQPAGGMTYRQLVKLREGVEKEKAKEVVRVIKDSKLKVQAAIQGDLVRVTGKKRDDLQEAIALLRGHEFEMPLQFVNFRD